MSYNPSVKLTRLFETTSKSGKTYLRGRLGFASIVILKSDQVSDRGQPIWNVLISEPEERQEYTPKAGKPDHQAPAEDTSPRTFERSKLDDEIPF